MNALESFVGAKSNFELTYTESISSKALYEKFLNWVSGEFELYLQDKLDGLKIFFPGGYLYITETRTNNNTLGLKIMVNSKCKQKGEQINNHVYSIFNHVTKLKKPSIS